MKPLTVDLKDEQRITAFHKPLIIKAYSIRIVKSSSVK